MLLPLFTVILMVVAVTAFYINEQLQTDDIIETVNNAKTTWQAGRNLHPYMKKNYWENSAGAISKSLPRTVQHMKIVSANNSFAYSNLPENFDARDKWKSCISLQEVRDQGACGSCWAVSPVAAFADRLCIASNGSFNGHLSAQQVMSCCSSGRGCAGGSPQYAWEYFQTDGVVTGGDYESEEGCQPYTIPECEHHVPGPRKPCNATYEDLLRITPKCQKECSNEKYNETTFYNDLHTINFTYGFPSFFRKTHHLMMILVQKEIFDHGPLTTVFKVYEDFWTYKKGIYQHITGGLIYEHSVKVIGWGVEEGTPYWLAANSWNNNWGDKGFFKIKRGNNECGFESMFLGGAPDVSKYSV